jgi:hypothetical protein
VDVNRLELNRLKFLKWMGVRGGGKGLGAGDSGVKRQEN